jgi:FMN phosphatase YigB (HAD superfamily)
MRQKRRCIKLLLLDAHGTIFTAKNRTWPNLLAYVVCEETGIALDGDLLYRRTKEIRATYVATSGAPQNSAEWWTEVNCRVLKLCGHDISPESGLRIHLRLVEAIDLYTVAPARRQFVERLVRKFFGGGVLRAVATNAPDAVIDCLLAEHNMRHLVQRIYGSGTGVALKPARAFFDEVLRRQGVKPEETLLVANSLLNDLPAALYGIHVCIIPRRTERFGAKDLHPYMSEPRVLVHATHSVTNAWEWIDRHFVAAP